MKTKSENIPASVQARLKNKASRDGIPFNEILQYYGMERFLYRLSQTQHVDDLILKGGLMFYGLEIPMRRTTRDIDFLGTLENMQNNILSIFRDAMSVEYPADGILFNIKTLRLSQSQAEENQGGIRITFVGYLGKTRMPIQVDIGFSDELASGALNMHYPVLLNEMKQPRLKGYPPESIISEKFHAMIRFADANSRWKDYYDIYLLAQTFEFDSHVLSHAIKTTFDSRSEEFINQIPYGLRDEFAIANQENWESFLSKSKLRNDSLKDLRLIVKRIWQFLEYPLHEIHFAEQEKSKRWTHINGWE
jgi:predicted nucleotidyltransferase component of viral defense system